MMLSAPSGMTSATIATTFDVPMSRPTIRFFASFTIGPPSPLVACVCPSGGSRLLDWSLVELRHVRREAIPITEVDPVDACSGARERRKGAAVHGDEAREPLARLVTTKLDVERPSGTRYAETPAAARRNPDLLQRKRQRIELGGPFAVTRRHVRRARVRAF